MAALLLVARVLAIGISACGYLLGQLWFGVFTPLLTISALSAIFAAILDMTRPATPAAYALAAVAAFGAAAVATVDSLANHDAGRLLIVVPYIASLGLIGMSLTSKYRRYRLNAA